MLWHNYASHSSIDCFNFLLNMLGFLIELPVLIGLIMQADSQLKQSSSMSKLRASIVRSGVRFVQKLTSPHSGAGGVAEQSLIGRYSKAPKFLCRHWPCVYIDFSLLQCSVLFLSLLNISVYFIHLLLIFITWCYAERSYLCLSASWACVYISVSLFHCSVL